MTNWQCARCRAQVAPGAPRCPQCPSTEFIKPEPEADMLKIARDGSVSDSADVKTFFEQLADVKASVAEANAERPADGDPQAEIAELREEVAELKAEEAAQAPDAAPAPAAPPRTPPRVPPRRTPPPGAAGD